MRINLSSLRIPAVLTSGFLFVLLLSAIRHSLAQEGAKGVYVVVNPKIPLDNLTRAELRKLVLGDKQFWSQNQRVTVLLRAPTAHDRDAVLKNICEMSEAQFKQHWIAKVFRAEAPSAPKTFYSSESATSLVAAIPGSIAFVESPQSPHGVKVVKVDGLLPGDKRYLLQ